MDHRKVPSSNEEQLRFSLLKPSHSSDPAKVAFPPSQMCMDDYGLRVHLNPLQSLKGGKDGMCASKQEEEAQAPANLDALSRPFSVSPRDDGKIPANEQSLSQLRRRLRTTM
jgi:hypothetical protein